MILFDMDRDAINHKDLDTLGKLRGKIRDKNNAKANTRIIRNILVLFFVLLVFSIVSFFTLIDRSIVIDTHLIRSGPQMLDNASELSKEDVLKFGSNRASLSSEVKAGTTSAEAKSVHVVKVIICKEIKNRKPVNEQKVFFMGDDQCVFVWTDIRSKKTPTKVKHIYYLNNEKYCEVPLKILYPRMRTWSKISLVAHKLVGKWRVDITTNKKKVLKQVEFEVRDAEKNNHPN